MHLTLDNIDSPYEKMDPMPVIARTIKQINTDEISNQQLAITNNHSPFSIVYAAGDRVVHQMERARFGLSMSSNRIGKYEAFITAVDTENVTGWYTGDGMTCLYTPDAIDHYASYVRRVNPYLIPGTTVDRVQRYLLRSDMVLFHHSSKAPETARAGGACLDGLYSVAGMQLLGFDAELYAKKSWFMFNREIVCLGSDIHQTRELEVITTVENRITDAPWRTGKTYAWLDKVAGYCFPEGDTFQTAVSEAGCKEMTISHGIAPADGHYAYVLLPRFTERETKRYASRPEIRILAHTNAVHAVAKPQLHLTAFCFFAEGEAAGLHSDGPACVLMRKEKKSVTLAVSEPTWLRDTQVLTLNGSYRLKDASVPGICSVITEKGKTRVTIASKDRMGQTLTVTLAAIRY
jgi:hyaluronate lyase